MSSIVDFLEFFWNDLQQGQLPQLGFWNYIVLAILIFWQGPVATLLGGAAASAGFLQPILVFLVGVTSNLTADILWYSIGRSGRIDKLFNENGRFGKHRDQFFRLQVGMRQHSTKILLFAKLTAGFAVLTLITAGFSGVKWRQWFPIVFLGETIWTGSLVLIGYFAAEAIKQVEQGLQLFALIFAFILLLVFAWFVPRQLRVKDLLSLEASNEGRSSEQI